LVSTVQKIAFETTLLLYNLLSLKLKIDKHL